jgi:hypothetical protein
LSAGRIERVSPVPPRRCDFSKAGEDGFCGISARLETRWNCWRLPANWRIRQDLNLQPSDPKSEALSN